MSKKEKKEKKPPGSVPDGGWGWMVVFGSAVIHFLVVGMGRSFGVFYLDMLDRFQGTAAATSWVVAIYNIFRMSAGPVAGLLCERFSVRTVAVVGGFITAAGCIITSFARSLLFAYFSFGCIAGFGASLLFAPSYIIVSEYFDKNKGKAMAISTMGAGLGTVGLAPLIQWLLNTYSFFGTMLILGALMLHNCCAGMLFRELPPPPLPPLEVEMNKLMDNDNGEPQVEEVVAKPPAKLTGCAALKNQLAILWNATFLLYGLQIMCMSIATQVFFCFLPAIAEQHGTERNAAAFLLSVMGFADMIGRFVFGFFFDLKVIRYRRRLFHTLLGFPLAASVFFTGFMDNYTAFFSMTIFFGLVEGGFHSQRATIVSEFVAKEQLSSTVGFVIFFQGGGIIAGPPVAGLLRDIYHSYNVCYFYAGLTVCISSLLFLAEYFIQKMLAKSRTKARQVQVEAPQAASS